MLLNWKNNSRDNYSLMSRGEVYFSKLLKKTDQGVLTFEVHPFTGLSQ
jgi:hypothetical protein